MKILDKMKMNIAFVVDKSIWLTFLVIFLATPIAVLLQEKNEKVLFKQNTCIFGHFQSYSFYQNVENMIKWASTLFY